METKFDVSPSAVVQLGENLYKNTYGVFIEYITNAYDADASYVKIEIHRENRRVTIEDDGVGMSLKELTDNFLSVGKNRRKKDTNTLTAKGRAVTGRKGFGKLACFGLFESFKIETIKDGLLSTFSVESSMENDEFEYFADIDEESIITTKPNGTKISLSRNTKSIVGNTSLAESIAKRINLMYDKSAEDKDGFKIYLADITIDKSFRDEQVLNKDIKFDYSIPQDLHKFTKNKDVINYFNDKGIHGIIIAREKTVRVKENKGIVLFARGKLCQEATYLNINPSNSYGYAHLYSELHVDFIDNERKDNIGTDRTALNETETTKELFYNIEVILKGYATLYDDDEKMRKLGAVEEFKDGEIYNEIKKSIDIIADENVKNELLSLLEMRIKDSVNRTKIDTESIQNFEKVSNSIITTLSVSSEQISKDEPKDNVTTSYDFLMEYLRNKYNYTESDGATFINFLFGQNSNNVKLNSLADCLTGSVPEDLKKSMRDLGSSIVGLRNSLQHTNNRQCINDNITIENSKRFLILVDLFIEMDQLFFELP